MLEQLHDGIAGHMWTLDDWLEYERRVRAMTGGSLIVGLCYCMGGILVTVGVNYQVHQRPAASKPPETAYFSRGNKRTIADIWGCAVRDFDAELCSWARSQGINIPL